MPFPPSTGETPPPVLVLEIRGPIDEALTYIVRRGVQEAAQRPTSALVLVMDTPGGSLDACRDIVTAVQKSPVPVFTFVERAAYSAGALIALSTKRIYMAPGSVIGDAMAILMPPLAGPQPVPEDLREKMDSGTSAFARATAELAGHDGDVAEAFVRRSMELKRDGTVLKPVGQLLTLTHAEAERAYGSPARPLLSAGTVKNLNELLAREGLAAAAREDFRVSFAERLARWIKLLGPLFLLGGILGIWIEIKTPGFGLPGALGIASLAIFFVGHHIAGLAGWEDIAFFLIGAILLLVEIFLLPGTVVLGVTGLVLMLAGLLMGMIERLPGSPLLPGLVEFQVPFIKLFVAVLGAGGAMALLGKYLPRTPGFRQFILESSTNAAAGFTSAGAADAGLESAVGIAESDLRPAGRALLNGRHVDVVTNGEYLPKGTPIRVAEAHGNRIVVVRDAGEKGSAHG